MSFTISSASPGNGVALVGGFEMFTYLSVSLMFYLTALRWFYLSTKK